MNSILITGACGGMGYSTCELFTSLGYRVYGIDVCDSRTPPCHKFFTADLKDTHSLEHIYNQITAECSELCAIIHMAGVYDLHSLVEVSEERLMGIFEANLFGVYRINKIFRPLLKEGSRIVITTSELAPLDPLPFTGIYAITKAALEKYAYSLRMELALHGISVSIIRPGAVKTGLLSVSMRALDEFCANTSLYTYNARRFKKIVESVESRNIPPAKIASVAKRALRAKKPRYVYNINRNPLLRLLNILPQRLQVKIISMILK